MADFGLSKRITSDVCNEMVLFSRRLLQIYYEVAGMSSKIRIQSELHEVGLVVLRAAEAIEHISVEMNEMGCILDDRLLLYTDCENRICDKCYEPK